MRLPDVDIRRLLGQKYKLICRFKLVRVASGSFLNDADRPAFLEREVLGLVVDGYQQGRVLDHARGPMPIYMFRDHLTCFSNVKCIIFLTLELVHQVGGFIVSSPGSIHYADVHRFESGKFHTLPFLLTYFLLLLGINPCDSPGNWL